MDSIRKPKVSHMPGQHPNGMNRRCWNHYTQALKELYDARTEGGREDRQQECRLNEK